MKLENEFVVPAAIEKTWDVLRDVERIAPCMPGAELTGRAGDDYLGTIRVKVGPISVAYEGRVSIVEEDGDQYCAVMKASGSERRGSGTAEARVSTFLKPAGDDRTGVRIETELAITGRPAQFGRGVMADVSQRLVDRFAENLAAELRTPVPVEDASGHQTTPEPAERCQTETLDMAAIAAGPVGRRLALVGVGVLMVVIMVRWFRK